jgi:hypothetical protein
MSALWAPNLPRVLPEIIFGHQHASLLVSVLRPLIALYNPNASGIYALRKSQILRALYSIETRVQ